MEFQNDSKRRKDSQYDFDYSAKDVIIVERWDILLVSATQVAMVLFLLKKMTEEEAIGEEVVLLLKIPTDGTRKAKEDAVIVVTEDVADLPKPRKTARTVQETEMRERRRKINAVTHQTREI